MAVTLNASTSSGFIQTADTSGIVEIQSNGTTKFNVASTGAYGQLVSGTAVASTSGTSIDFTSIPSWVKRITVMFNAISTTGTSNYQVQIGAGSVTTSGYTSGSTEGTAGAISTTGFTAFQSPVAARTYSGVMTITLITGNTWVYSSVLACVSNAQTATQAAGNIALGGTLDRVRITTVSGDTFDAGSINILYEG
jgi:hypothetical protein